MSGVLHAFTAFFDHLRAIAWLQVLLALACQLAKTGARTRAWRNILAAAYPDARVRWRSVFGAYIAGVGVNAVVPVRGGDLLRLSIVKRRIEGATYATLASSLLVETIVDALLSGVLLVWALQQHILPGVDVLDRLPSVDWFWLFRHPRTAAAVLIGTLAGGFALALWAAARIRTFRARVAQGVTILRTPGRYLRSVAAWQLADWALRLAAIYFFLRAFHVTGNLDNALRVQVTQSLSTIVPLTPAGIGTEQALIAYVLSGEASRTALLSFSVGMKAIVSALNVALGALSIAVTLRTLNWRRAVESDVPPA
jgi:glycosyltransferase 2 family protein